MPETRVNSSGQIALPKSILRYLDLHAGDRVEFERTADGRVVLKKVGVPRPPPLVRPGAKSNLREMEVEVEHVDEKKPGRTDD